MTNVTYSKERIKTELQDSDKGNIVLQRVFNTSHDFKIPKIVDVGPDEAKEILNQNNKNRNLRKHHVKWLSIQMKLGYWVFCGQVLGLDKKADLINLQHTLHAIVDSGTTQKFIAISGLSSKAIEVMDTGMARTAADVLKMNDIKNSSSIASIVARVMHFEIGRHASILTNSSGRSASTPSKTGKGDLFKSNVKILEIVNSDESYWQELNKVSAIFYRSFGGLTQTEYATLYHFASKLDESAAFSFFSKLSSGVGLKENSPIYHLRRKLEKEMLSKVKHTAREKLFWILTCWNKYRENTPMFQMSPYSSGSAIPEMI